MSPNPNSIHELGLGDKEKLSINLGSKLILTNNNDKKKFCEILLWPQKMSIPTHSMESWEILQVREWGLKDQNPQKYEYNKTERAVGDGSSNQ